MDHFNKLNIFQKLDNIITVQLIMSAASNILTVRYVPCAALFHLLAIFATHCHPPSLEVIQLKAKNKK